MLQEIEDLQQNFETEMRTLKQQKESEIRVLTLQIDAKSSVVDDKTNEIKQLEKVSANYLLSHVVI